MARGTDWCGGETSSTKVGGRGILECRVRSVASMQATGACDILQMVWRWVTSPLNLECTSPVCTAFNGMRRLRVPSLNLPRTFKNNCVMCSGGRSTVQSPRSRSRAENDDGRTWRGIRVIRLYSPCLQRPVAVHCGLTIWLGAILCAGGQST